MRNKGRQPYLPRSDNTNDLSVHKRMAKGRNMKKFFLAVALLALLLLCSCASEADKANYNISKQADYFESEGDQLQVKINGTTYLVHSSNVVLWNGTKTKPGEKVASRE